MLGHQQKNWMYRQLVSSTATWNVLAQQVMMEMVNRSNGPDTGKYSMDQWPGYAAERMEIVRFMQERRVANPVVLVEAGNPTVKPA